MAFINMNFITYYCSDNLVHVQGAVLPGHLLRLITSNITRFLMCAYVKWRIIQLLLLKFLQFRNSSCVTLNTQIWNNRYNRIKDFKRCNQQTHEFIAPFKVELPVLLEPYRVHLSKHHLYRSTMPKIANDELSFSNINRYMQDLACIPVHKLLRFIQNFYH